KSVPRIGPPSRLGAWFAKAAAGKTGRREKPLPQSLQLDIADFHGGEVLAMAALDLVLVGLLVLPNRDLGAAALADELAGHAGFRSVGANQNLFVVRVNG